MRIEKVYAVFIGLFSLSLIIFAFAVPVQGLRKKQLDQQTSSALSEIEPVLSSYTSENNGELPKSLKDLDFGEYSSLKNNKSALDRITIEGDKSNYKLCGFFYTDTKTDDEKEEMKADIGSTFKYAFGGASLYGNRFTIHDKGNYCFDSENYPAEDYGGGVDLYNYSGGDDLTQSASDKSDDASRRSEINAIYGQVEVYFAVNDKYPTLDDLNSSTFRDKELKNLTADSFTDPRGNVDLLTQTQTIDSYAYTAVPEGCDNASSDCTGFTLTATLSNGEQYTKTGLNN